MLNTRNAAFLQSHLDQEAHEDYPITSRIHPLRSLHGYVKREDELGFGISGTKFRKYRTLLPYLRQDNCREVVIIGGPFSNHVLGITQLLLENELQPTLFLKGPPYGEPCGNFFFLQMLVPPSSIQWISKEDWPKVEQLALAYANTKTSAKILPEGAAIFPTFLGALTLPLDILRNEGEVGVKFDHLFLDVGTGYSAAALLLGFAYMERPTFCHLLLLADTEEVFRRKLHDLHAEFERWLGEKCPFPTQFSCARSTLAPSFGSTNTELFQFLIKTTRVEGFFLDPIYSGKLFYHAQQQADCLSGNTLLIHSGGALTLSGFQKPLALLTKV